MGPAAIPPDGPPAQRLAALVIARDGAIVLVLGGPERWRRLQAYTLAPIELPGGSVAAAMSLSASAAQIATRLLGRPAHALPSKHTYGRTSAHAIDRLNSFLPTDMPPLIYLERGLPDEQDATRPPGQVTISVYRGVLDGDPVPARTIAGLLWLPLPALRQAVRGLPVADLCAMHGVVWRPAPQVNIPGDLFVYVPAEYGERYLLRVAAKYGAVAIFQDDEPQNRE